MGVRANGLSLSLGLGLLSGMVGLLQSCIEYQEVIEFLIKLRVQTKGELIN